MMINNIYLAIIALCILVAGTMDYNDQLDQECFTDSCVGCIDCLQPLQED